MPAVMITCPKTRNPVSTGLTLGSNHALAALEQEARQAACPHCAEQHKWRPSDAYLQAEDDEEGFPFVKR